MSRFRSTILPVTLAAVLFVLAWKAVVVIGGYPVFILPPPETVFARLVEAWVEGTMTPHALATLSEIGWGLLVGASSAVVVGYLLARSPLAERLFSPYLVAAQATPILALAPLLVLWLGTGLAPKVVICALIVFFPVAVATMVGIRSVDGRLLELGRSLRATRWQIVRHLEIPAALPQILGGLRVGATLAVIGAIVGEWSGADRGLGYLINLARGSLFDIPLMFATLVTIAAIGVLLYLAVVLAELGAGRSLEVVVDRRIWSFAVLIFLTAQFPGTCGPGAAPTPGPTRLTVGLGYIPSVQFAQFYRAQQQGYYSSAGLDVTFQNEIDPNLVTLVGQGQVDIGIADGTSVIPAVGQGIPIRYAATIYARFPNVVITPADSGIVMAADLAGHSIGIPGRYGSSWIMLQAMLASAGLTPNDVEIRNYPDFGQATGLLQRQVDAATGFRNNEPVQLAGQGFATNVLAIDEITPLPGPGLIVSNQILVEIGRSGTVTQAQKADAIRSFIAATLRAMEEIKVDPELGLDDTFAVVPDLAAERDAQRAILLATIETWESPYTAVNGVGAIDPAAWTTSLDFMRGLPESNIPSDLTVDKLVTEELLP